jgi:hypothetical protein
LCNEIKIRTSSLRQDCNKIWYIKKKIKEVPAISLAKRPRRPKYKAESPTFKKKRIINFEPEK